MDQDFFAPVANWQNARKQPQIAKGRGSSTNIFSGRTTLDKANLDGVEVLRISVSPDKRSAAPSSFAVLEGVDWHSSDSAHLPFNLEWQQPSSSLFKFSFSLPAQTQCLGLGERYSGLNLKGKTHTLFTTDDVHHIESIDAMYKAIPFLILYQPETSFGFFLDSPALQRWNLDTSMTGEGGIELLSRRGWQFYVIGPATLSEIVGSYSQLTGRTKLPPLWSLGHQQSRWSYPDEKTVADLAHEFRSRKIPCDTIVLDIDYMDEYRVFTHSPERFPHFRKLIADLARQNFKVVTIVDPGVKKDSKYSVFNEGKKQKLFCATADGDIFLDKVWPGISAFPDFLNAKTRKWWGQLHRFYLENGVAGIWNDMNEPAFFNDQKPLPKNSAELPSDAEQLFLQQSPEGQVGHFEVRNLYGSLMSRATHEGLLSLSPNERPFVLTRSGYAGVQRYAAVWLGDNCSWWEHLALSIPMLLNMSLSGVPFCGVDVGGFGCDATGELLIRWYELGIFYPFFRNHCSMRGRSQEPWVFGPDVENRCRKLIEWRYRLLPYFQALFWEHLRTGAPLMRPLLWHYPNDAVASEIDDQFLLGRDILVTPVLRRGRLIRPIYFPEGKWYPLEGGDPIDGGKWYTLSLALGETPAFVREGAILPMAEPMQSTAEYDDSTITFTCYGETCSGSYFEDDGHSFDYEKDKYNQWLLSFTESSFKAIKVKTGYFGPPRKYQVEHNGQQQFLEL